jgi:3-dehydrocarnitine:acetyl-CoA trimethylamine transferase
MPRKVIVTCAVTGSGDTTRINPAVPVTPEEIAREGLAAAEAGAAVLHIHVRDPHTSKPSMDPALYAEVVERIRARNREVVVNLTTGAGARFVPGAPDPAQPGPGTTLANPGDRVRHIEALRPDLCSLDVGSLNFGASVFVNTPSHLSAMAARIRAAGVKPELEVFDTGHIRQALQMLADGELGRPPLFQLCLGIRWGAAATPETLLFMRDLLPPDAVWSAFGISRDQFPMVAQAVLAGGHVRVGLEDNLYLDRGALAPGNAALVERAVEVVRTLGEDVATPVEARELFGLRAPN